MADLPVSRLVIEPVESLVHSDRSAIFEALQKGRNPSLVYEHVLARHEPILWAADALAWAVGAGGDWCRRTNSVVERRVDTDR